MSSVAEGRRSWDAGSARNWTDDGTGINDTGTGPDEGASTPARMVWPKALAVVFVGIWIIGLYMNCLLQAEYGA